MRIAVAGGSGGIGNALVRQLLDDERVESVEASYFSSIPKLTHKKLTWTQVDVCSEESIAQWLTELGEIDWLINAVGMLHTATQGPEKAIRQIDPAFFLQNMQINALPTLLLAKHAVKNLKHGRPAIFATVSARVGSIEDNYLGGWYSYRASKAALNMALKTLSIEWRRTLPKVCVAALHPGTTDTALSKPFQRNVPEGQLFPAEKTADYLIDVLGTLTVKDSGRFWAFDKEELPW